MPILKYFVIVGLALTAGLWALSAHLTSGNAARAARAPTTMSVPIATPAQTAAAESEFDAMVGPHMPDKPAKASTAHHSHSNRDTRRSVR